MGTKLRWGILGAADIARRSVVPGIQQSESGVAAAIASRTPVKAEAAAAELNIPKAYGSYEALLADDSIDAVYIPLPNHLHMEWTIRAAEAGKHVLCEKPIALNAAEAERMADACAKSGVHLAEAFMYRHHPRYVRIRELVRSGEIGELRSIHGTFTFNNADDAANVRFRKDWGGGSLYDIGCYPISAARFITGAEPAAATVHAFFSPQHDDVDMMASGLLEFAGGVSLTFDCGMWASFRNTLEIVGSDGRIVIPEAFVGSRQEYDVHTKDGVRTEMPDAVNSYACEIDDFAAVVRGEQRAAFPASDSIANMRVLDACLLSAREKRRVEL